MTHADIFAVDLLQQAKQHILFLRNLHKHGITINADRSGYEESFRRYSDLWLPFVYKHSYQCAGQDGQDGEALIPPADIAWMWHCHRLAPYRYARFVSRKFLIRNDDAAGDTNGGDKQAGRLATTSFRVLDASIPFVFQLENNDTNETLSCQEHVSISRRTHELFLAMYPNESFFLKEPTSQSYIQEAKSTVGVQKNTKLAGFDVVESCIRQATFLWQVSGPRFSTVEFLEARKV
jgi:hypothetical protein